MATGWILIAVLVLIIIFLVLFFLRKNKKKQMSKLGSFSLLFVLAGIIFGDNKILGYSLIGIGIILAIIDIISKEKK